MHSSARYGIAIADDNDDIPDYPGINDQSIDRIDSLLGHFECTSGTRPNAPANGMLIWETDTKARAVWDANAAPSGKWLHFDTQWQQYTPQIKHGNIADGSPNIALGPGYLSGWYFRQGRVIRVKVGFQVGVGTNYNGTGQLYIGYPFPRQNLVTLPDPEGTWRGVGAGGVMHGLVLTDNKAFASLVVSDGGGVAFDAYINNTHFPSNPNYWVADLEYQTF